MPGGIVGQIGSAEELGEIGAVIVEVAGHPDFAGCGEDDGLLVTEDGEAIFLGGGIESFGDLGEAGHGVIRRRIGGVRQAEGEWEQTKMESVNHHAAIQPDGRNRHG